MKSHYLKFPYNIKNLVSGVVVGSSVFLVLLSLNLLYENAQVTTDENWFQELPSRALVAVDIEAERLTIENDNSTIEEYSRDTIFAGDLICRVGDANVRDTSDLWNALRSMSGSHPVFLEILSPQTNTRRVFRVQKSKLQSSRFVTIPPAAHVVEVLPEGVSDRAGMKVGDLIVSINNQEFEDIYQADRIMRESQYGTQVDYVVIRGAQSLLLEIQLASFGLQLHIISSFIVGLIMLILGMLLASLRPQYVGALVVGCALICTGFVIMTQQLAPIALGTDQIASSLRILALPALVSLWSVSLMYFPRVRKDVQFRRTRIGIAALLCTPFVFITLVTFVHSAIVDVDELVRMSREIMYGADLVFIAFLILHVLVIGNDILVDKSSEARANLLFDAVFPVVVVLVFLLASAANARGDLQIRAAMYLATILIPVAVLISIGRYRLFDLELRVRRNIHYVALSTLWTLFIFGCLVYLLLQLPSLNLPIPSVRITGISIEVVDNLSEEERAFGLAISYMIIALTAGFVLMKVRVAGHKLISRLFYQSDRDYRSVGSSLSELIGSSHDPRGLSAGYSWWLARNMDIEKIGILVLKDLKISSVGTHQLDQAQFRRLCEKWEAVLIEVFAHKHTDVSIDQLPEPIRNDIANSGVTHILPMRSEKSVVGLVFLGEKLSETEFTWDELEFIGSTAKQVGVAIENVYLTAELHEQERLKTELAIARRVQLESLPQSTPNIEGLDIAGISSPALEVGGDFYDYHMSDENMFTVVVGDVSGKGTSAAFYMSKIQGVLKTLHGFFLSPKQLLVKTNEILKPDMASNSFITSVCAQFAAASNFVVFARAGHCPILHYKHGEKKAVLNKPVGIGIGIVDSTAMTGMLSEMELYYEPGDVFIFVSDGVTEARNPAGREFGIERVQGIVQEIADKNARYIRDRILTAAQKFAGEEGIQHDDLTIVVVKAT